MATFSSLAQEQYTVTLHITGNGSIALFSITPFTSGQTITLTANPKE